MPCPRCDSETDPRARWCLACGHWVDPPSDEGPISRGDAGPILPILMAADWPASGAEIRRRLCPMPAHLAAPWVAWHQGSVDHPLFVGPARLAALGLTAETLEREALFNQTWKRASWRPCTLELEGHDAVNGLTVSDDPYACERFLEPDFLQYGQLILRARALAVGLPHRGLLLAAPIDDALQGGFLRMVEAYHAAAGPAAAVTPLVFAVEDGVVLGRIFNDPAESGVDVVV